MQAGDNLFDHHCNTMRIYEYFPRIRERRNCISNLLGGDVIIMVRYQVFRVNNICAKIARA